MSANDDESELADQPTGGWRRFLSRSVRSIPVLSFSFALVLVWLLAISFLGGAANVDAGQTVVMRIAPLTNPYDEAIRIACHASALPKSVPPSGAYWVWEVRPSPAKDAGGELDLEIGSPGSVIAWGHHGSDDTYACAITNFGDARVSDVTMRFDLSLLGGTASHQDRPIEIQEIPPGAANAFQFSVLNKSQDTARLLLPLSATFRPSDETERVSAKLFVRRGDNSTMLLGPARE